MLAIMAVFVVLLTVALLWALSHPMFGRLPRGERLRRVQASPNYSDGTFVNKTPKPFMAEGATPLRLGWDFLFKKKERSRPSRPLPTEKLDLTILPADQNILIWLGHSSLFMQLDGKKFLIDPNFTSYASPFTWRTYSFDGTDLYSFSEIPDIDYLFITHDHFDHLNYDTIVALKDKIGTAICGLGVGEHLEYWGIPPERIIETDWEDHVVLDDGMILHTLPTHHFSGRTLWNRNPTLWVAFVLKTPSLCLYFGGDNGYGVHFAEAGNQFGPFDLVILENGQYDKNWPFNHMQPEEVRQAAADLKAKRLLPVHAGRFVLSNHPWNDPFTRIAELMEGEPAKLLTPRIGQPIYFDNLDADFDRWWEGIE